jgi:hypothetical protein
MTEVVGKTAGPIPKAIRHINITDFNNDNGKKERVVWTFGIHAREWISPALGQGIIMRILKGSRSEEFDVLDEDGSVIRIADILKKCSLSVSLSLYLSVCLSLCLCLCLCLSVSPFYLFLPLLRFLPFSFSSSHDILLFYAK